MPDKETTALVPGRYGRTVTNEGYTVKDILNISGCTDKADTWKVIRTMLILRPDGETLSSMEEEWKASFSAFTKELTGIGHPKQYFFIPEDGLMVTGSNLYKRIPAIPADE